VASTRQMSCWIELVRICGTQLAVNMPGAHFINGLWRSSPNLTSLDTLFPGHGSVSDNRCQLNRSMQHHPMR